MTAAPTVLSGNNVLQFADPHGLVLAEGERQFQALLGALPVAIYTTDAAGNITYYNEAAAEFWGHRPALGSSMWCGSWKLYWPDGTVLLHHECPMALCLKRGETIRGYEAVAERPDGTRVPFIPYPTPLRDAEGNLTGAVNMLVDISDRKRAENAQALLVRELHHRVKNTLATVQAMVGATMRSSASFETFKEKFGRRIAALAKTHTLITDHPDQAASLKDLLRGEIEVFGYDPARMTLRGPEVLLPSRMVVPFGMTIHELATNAAKYGALSVPEGALAITWKLEVDADGTTLFFDWTESGVSLVQASRNADGFGSLLLKKILRQQIGAELAMTYNPDGLRVLGTIPIRS